MGSVSVTRSFSLPGSVSLPGLSLLTPGVTLFYICGPLVKKATLRFLKDCVLAVLLSKMSRHCPSNVLQDILGDKDGSGNPRVFAHLSGQIFAHIQTCPYCLVCEEPIHWECQKWYYYGYLRAPFCLTGHTCRSCG